MQGGHIAPSATSGSCRSILQLVGWRAVGRWESHVSIQSADLRLCYADGREKRPRPRLCWQSCACPESLSSSCIGSTCDALSGAPDTGWIRNATIGLDGYLIAPHIIVIEPGWRDSLLLRCSLSLLLEKANFAAITKCHQY